MTGVSSLVDNSFGGEIHGIDIALGVDEDQLSTMENVVIERRRITYGPALKNKDYIHMTKTVYVIQCQTNSFL
ncbi:MAG: hypothetical protein GKR95_00900 [Gammaproteobacteria bacterium]|nr:hypothetical protein [Gammaproteobacteria bacterium]